MHSIRSILIIGLLCGAARASEPQNPSTAQLLADVSAIKPGEQFTVGILFKMKPGWHVYWINPGDSGLPPSVKWRLPDGFQISGLKFPVPREFDDAGGLVAYGYADEVLLTAKVTPPSDLKTGSRIPIGADASWLVCEQICLPGEAKLSIELPVSESATPANRELFEMWRRRAPRNPTDLGVKIRSNKNCGAHELHFEIDWKDQLPTNIEWFPPPTDSVTFSDIRISNTGNRTMLVVKFSPLARKPLPTLAMESVLAYDAPDGTRHGMSLPIEFQSESNRVGKSNP